MAGLTDEVERLRALLRSARAENTLLAEANQRLAYAKDRLTATIAAFPDANDAANLAHARAERDELREQLRRIEQPDTWGVPDEPDGVTEVWDRRGRRWERGAIANWMVGYEHFTDLETTRVWSWRQLVVNEGRLYRHPPEAGHA